MNFLATDLMLVPINAVTAAHHVIRIRNVNILREHALRKKQNKSSNTEAKVTTRKTPAN